MLAYGHQKHVTEYTEIGLRAQSMETSLGSIGNPTWREFGWHDHWMRRKRISIVFYLSLHYFCISPSILNFCLTIELSFS